VSVEVDGRQRYLFESDKLREMLGASRVLAATVHAAERHLQSRGARIFSPVSGEIRAWAPLAERSELLDGTRALGEELHSWGLPFTVAYLEVGQRHFLEDHDAGIRTDAGLVDRAVEPTEPSLAWVHAALGERIRAIKLAKPGVDPTPGCSLFTPCRIHGTEPANYWAPGSDADGETRRELISARAFTKLATWQGDRADFYRDLLFEPVWERICELLGDDPGADRKNALQRAIVFRDLSDELDAPGERADQYIAFLCADGDATGRLLGALDWNASEWNARHAPWERGAAFAFALDRCVRDALGHAIATVSIPDRTSAERILGQEQVFLPVLPQLRGGEDIWMLAARGVALPLACAFAQRHEQNAQDEDGVLAAALDVARALGRDPGRMTISHGVAFTKAAYPVAGMVAAAESLLAQAKRLRKGLLGAEAVIEPCVDWHWIESSIAEPVSDARAAGWRHSDHDGGIVALTTRPWTVEQTVAMRCAAKSLDVIARRKREQLDMILRLGDRLSSLAWEGWYKRLTGVERMALAQLAAELPDGFRLPQIEHSPWIEGFRGHKRATALLDLLGLTRLDRPGREREEDAADAAA
jgi:hypothetical protein